MDSHKLKLFVTLAETLHFNRAATTCNVSPSTLSRCIQQLEEELHTTLFERDNRSVSITPEGQRLLQFARETLQQWETLQGTLQRQDQSLRGAISLYCSVTASYSFLYDILKDFRTHHPLIEIKLHTGDPALAVDRITSGLEDIAIAARLDPMPQAVEFKRITYSPLILIQPLKPYWGRSEPALDPNFWSTVPFILSERGVARERLDHWFRERSINPNVYAQVAGHEAIVSMVSLGFGLGLIPQIVLDNSPLKSNVQTLTMSPPLQPYEVGLCVLSRRLKSPVVHAFWEQIEQGVVGQQK